MVWGLEQMRTKPEGDWLSQAKRSSGQPRKKTGARKGAKSSAWLLQQRFCSAAAAARRRCTARRLQSHTRLERERENRLESQSPKLEKAFEIQLGPKEVLMSAGDDDDRWGLLCVTANVLTPKEQRLERFLGSECVFVTLQ